MARSASVIPVGTLATIWPPHMDSASPSDRCDFVSPTQTIASSPARRAARLRGDEGVGLAMIPAALGMSGDDGARSGVLQHLRADVSGVVARDVRVAVLPTDGDAAAGDPGGLGDQGRWRANENFHVRLKVPRHRGDLVLQREPAMAGGDPTRIWTAN